MSSEIQTDFMEQALQQARRALQDGELPFGAVVVQNGRVISVGRCRERTAKTVLAHAELEAVDSACRTLGTNKLEDCIIYCTNEPCPMCAAAIFQAKIPSVVIGASRKDLPYLRPRTIDMQSLANDCGYPVTITRDVLKREVLQLHPQ